jgi:hypothetical protein
VNREAELDRPSRVACSDLLDHSFIPITDLNRPAKALHLYGKAVQTKKSDNLEMPEAKLPKAGSDQSQWFLWEHLRRVSESNL